jgi:hypothetical protein
VRVEEEQVDAVELDAVHVGRRREAQHGVQIDWRLGVGAFADQAGPGGVVEFGVVIHVLGHVRVPRVVPLRLFRFVGGPAAHTAA